MVEPAPGRPVRTTADPAGPVGTIAAGVLDGRAVTVVRHESGWVAVDESCTHADCPFSADGEVFDGTVLACNCHGSEFDLRTGEVLLGPAEQPLAVIPLHRRNGALEA